MRFNTKYLGYATLAGLLVSGVAYAANQTVNANANFDTALTLTKNNDINFGVLQAMTTGRYVITPAGVVTASNGGVVIGGTPNAAQINITGSAGQTLSIRTGTYTADKGVTPSVATCDYNGHAIADCDAGEAGLAPPGAGGHLLNLGVRIDTDGTQAAGTTAAPTFVVTVVYG